MVTPILASLAHNPSARTRNDGVSVAPPGARPVGGGMDWEGEVRQCEAMSRKSGAQCTAAPVAGESFCMGHMIAQGMRDGYVPRGS